MDKHGNGKKAFATLLSSPSYAVGVLALAESLRRVNSAHELVCVCSKDVNRQLVDKISTLGGVKCIALERTINVLSDVQHQSENYHWQYTFDKLQLWGLTEYEKIVYLDSDMVVMQNIDDLFERPAFSAVAAGQLIHPTWNRLNSGTLVIEPSEKVMESLLESIQATIEERSRDGQSTGDQDVLNHYLPTWPSDTALHLPESYNLLFKHLSVYMREHGYSYDGSGDKAVKIVHFIGAKKPWHLKGVERRLYLLKLMLQNPCGLKAYKKYIDYISKTEKWLKK